ncbi:hypothetical protein T492DRAFT_891555 [Pavlovales sp. CCMP2436]|nr:hypothetical protein T492DRAFT_891555 [Pavlovales sp. CCMP2436]
MDLAALVARVEGRRAGDNEPEIIAARVDIPTSGVSVLTCDAPSRPPPPPGGLGGSLGGGGLGALTRVWVAALAAATGGPRAPAPSGACPQADTGDLGRATSTPAPALDARSDADARPTPRRGARVAWPRPRSLPSSSTALSVDSVAAPTLRALGKSPRADPATLTAFNAGADTLEVVIAPPATDSGRLVLAKFDLAPDYLRAGDRYHGALSPPSAQIGRVGRYMHVPVPTVRHRVTLPVLIVREFASTGAHERERGTCGRAQGISNDYRRVAARSAAFPPRCTKRAKNRDGT